MNHFIADAIDSSFAAKLLSDILIIRKFLSHLMCFEYKLVYRLK